MKITLLVTSFFSLAGLSKAFQTIRPGQKKDVVVPKKETAPDEPSPFTPWPASRVIAHGDYRDESWLDEHIGGPLYSQQKDLPLLPVPSLEETMETFALSALPMARSKAEEENVKDACNKFIEQAQLLQKRLLALRDACQDTSWLQKFWNTQGYLQYRDPVAVKVSYFLYVPDDRTLPDVSHKGVARGAALLAALAQGRKAICSGSMAAESMRNEPICSNGFKYLWHSCRVPQPQQDTYHLYDPSRYNHCVVACKGQFFKVDFVDAQGDPLPVRVLEQSLQQCVEQAAAQENKHHPQLGWLTSLPRDAWAQARHELLDVGGKPVQEALEMLESGAFALNLDEDEPATITDAAKVFWHGGPVSGGNRWFDKSMQLICTRNGRVAYVGEHSMLDAAPVISVINRMLKSTYKRLCKKEPELSEESSPDEISNVTPIFANCWSSPEVLETAQRLVDTARVHHLELTNNHELQVLLFQDYGKKFIKNAGFSNCDDFVQMAMQVAAYRLFGEPVATYEAALTRYFLHGRTEAVRTVSPTSRALCEAMMQDDTTVSRTIKRALLREATDAQAEYQRKAAQGLGVDRHLFGLQNMLHDGECEPALFSDPVFQRSKHWRLSTSFVTYAPGFGPVVDDGLGIGYGVNSDSCIFTCTSLAKNDYTGRFCQELERALTELGDLVSLRDDEKDE